MVGTPKYTAVAAMMRSGISGISARGTSRIASMIGSHRCFLQNVTWVVQRLFQIGVN
jgi:hypothetical protein